ncbi:MAG: CDP-alcohol phosphatidyltransferase family protein [Candidatus Nanopelagicaceae bacterium]
MKIVIDESTTLDAIIKDFTSSESDLILEESGFEVHQPHLDEIIDFPHRQSAALVAGVGDDERADIFAKNKLIRSVRTSIHSSPAANRRFVGVLRLSINQRSEILSALQEGRDPRFASIPVLDLMLLLLVRNAIPITPVGIGKDPWRNPSRGKSAPLPQLTARALRRLKLTLANRSNDGFFSVLVLRRLSKPITALSVRFGISPNLITFVSLLIGFYSAYLFSQQEYLIGALLFQLSLIVDCSDGEVARYTRKFSNFGRWFDASTDRVKEYTVYAALAYSAPDAMWPWAIALMALQTFRHLSDYTYSAISQAREGGLIKRDIHGEDDGFSAPQWRGESEFKYWVKKVLNFPIGERWLAISVLAAIGGGELVFPGMLFLGSVSLLYAWLTRIRRTLRWRGDGPATNVVEYQKDLFISSPFSLGGFSWAMPSIIRAKEFLLILAIAWFIDRESIDGYLFLALFAIVYHHYDALYRALQNQSFPRWLSLLGLRFEGRIIVTAAFIALEAPVEILAGYFILLFMGVASAQWFLQIRKPAHA